MKIADVVYRPGGGIIRFTPEGKPWMRYADAFGYFAGGSWLETLREIIILEEGEDSPPPILAIPEARPREYSPEGIRKAGLPRGVMVWSDLIGRLFIKGLPPVP